MLLSIIITASIMGLLALRHQCLSKGGSIAINFPHANIREIEHVDRQRVRDVRQACQDFVASRHSGAVERFGSVDDTTHGRKHSVTEASLNDWEISFQFAQYISEKKTRQHEEGEVEARFGKLFGYFESERRWDESMKALNRSEDGLPPRFFYDELSETLYKNFYLLSPHFGAFLLFRIKVSDQVVRLMKEHNLSPDVAETVLSHRDFRHRDVA